jgi:hypothetical protein
MPGYIAAQDTPPVMSDDEEAANQLVGNTAECERGWDFGELQVPGEQRKLRTLALLKLGFQKTFIPKTGRSPTTAQTKFKELKAASSVVVCLKGSGPPSRRSK